MTRTKLYLSFTLLMLFLLLNSCKKEQQPQQIVKNPWKRSKADRIETDKYIDAGEIYFQKLNYDSAYYCNAKAKLSAEVKRDTSRIILSLLNLAKIHYTQSDYTGAETTATEILSLLEKNKDHAYNYNINLLLGNISTVTSEYNNALRYYKKALKLRKTTVDEKIDILHNIGWVYIEMKQFKKAAYIFEYLLTKKESSNNIEAYTLTLTHLGFCYLELGKPKVLEYYLESLRIALKTNNISKVNTYGKLSIYYKKKDFSIANNYAVLGYNAATTLRIPDDRLTCLQLLIELNSGATAKNYALQYLHLNDSITKVRQRAKNQYAKIRYDSKKEREENLQLKVQKIEQEATQKKKNIFFYLIVGTITAIGIVITYLLLAKNKREKVKATYATEIRISKKLHDELANDVYQTMAFAETQDLSTTRNKEILLSNLDTIYSRTRNISKENITVETGPAFLSDFKEMMTDFNTHEVNVIANGLDAINWSTLDSNIKIILYRVIQELLVNMKKYSQCSLVLLTFNLKEKKLQIDYMDNGIGATENQLKSKNGLQNVENRILAVKGNISFDTSPNKGFKVQIVIPT
ncbi:ATP-binding protein [Flavobacterium sp. XS1P32]|uniref:tetratricopeptide repeat-containing sensor histidine kinase n=1 Tax=Flavobacterium sp. XS1P32 TaxID=3401726 RepID=UPI003AAE87E0